MDLSITENPGSASGQSFDHLWVVDERMGPRQQSLAAGITHMAPDSFAHEPAGIREPENILLEGVILELTAFESNPNGGSSCVEDYRAAGSIYTMSVTKPHSVSLTSILRGMPRHQSNGKVWPTSASEFDPFTRRVVRGELGQLP
jgi:hypothetical protein